MSKQCSVCKETKPFSEYFRNRTTKDGFVSDCKQCRKIYVMKAQSTKRLKSPNGAQFTEEQLRERREYNRRWRQENRNKKKAHKRERRRKLPYEAKAARVVSYACETGRLTRKPCEVCGNPKADAHHDSYYKEDYLRVRFLCSMHHRLWHLNNKPKIPESYIDQPTKAQED